MPFSLELPRRRRARTAAALLLAAAASVAVSLSAQTKPLVLVSTAWPPFTNLPGQPRFALDLVEAAFARIGVSSRTTLVNADQFTTSLLTGQFDGSAAAWKDPDRERVLLFSKPYLENRLVLVARRGGDVSARALADLKGKRVAIVEGYSYGDLVAGADGPTFVRSRSEEDSLSRLLNGSVDGTLMDELVVQDIVRNYPKESATRLAIGSVTLIKRDLYLALRRSRPDAESIISRFNEQLTGMIVDRTYHRLLHVDWIRADINGDGVTEYVPANEKTGPSEPQRIYSLSSPPPPTTAAPTKPGFYVGGNTYSDWASVPDSYKEVNSSQAPDPRRSTGSIFKFSW